MSTNKVDDGKSLGILYTGYLQKKNPMSGTFSSRFVVLTLESLHWFLRSEGYDLFGEERGQVTLNCILTAKILDEDSTMLEIQNTDTKKFLFRAPSQAICEEWVSAIKSAIKILNSNNNKRGINRRQSLAGIKNAIDGDEEVPANADDVTVLLISLSSIVRQSELVIARKPDWDRVIIVPAVYPGDQILISISNGGIVRLTQEYLSMKAEDDGIPFEVPIQNVALASSLKITTTIEDIDVGASNRSKSSNKKVSLLERIYANIIILTSERSTSITLVLSVMVMIVTLSSFRVASIDTSLLYVFAPMLAIYNFTEVLRIVYKSDSDSKSVAFRIILHGHAFTSPDAPVNEPDEEIPKRFIDGCDGDLKEARRRWDITRHWRETEGANTILQEPQPYFNLIKQMYPHYHAGRGKEGHVIFWERPGDFQGKQLEARGVKTDDLVRHWLFNTEYQWQILCNGDETAKSIAIIDINGIGMSDLGGSNMDYIKKTLAIANQHYPERSYIIYVLNAPFFASMMWKLIKPLVHPNTQKKVNILSSKETLDGLLKNIDISQIPEYYGGKLDFGGHDSARFSSPETMDINEYVRKLNEGVVDHAEDGSTSAAVTKVPFASSSPQNKSSNNSNSTSTNAAAGISGNNTALNTLEIAPPGNPGENAPYMNAPSPALRRKSSFVRPNNNTILSPGAPSVVSDLTTGSR